MSVKDNTYSVTVEGDAYETLSTDAARTFAEEFLKPYRLGYRVVRADREEIRRREAIAELNRLSGGKLTIKE